MKLTPKQNSDRVQIEVVLLDEHQGWDTQAVWVPRKIAESESQDAFIEWVYSDDGEAWRETWVSVMAVYVHNFTFEEVGDDSTYVLKGTQVRVARDADSPFGLKAEVGDTGETREDGRIGPGASRGSLIDVLLSNGNEVTVFADQLDEITNE